jgi:ribonuclease BN (tRNA processing enzyme)
MRKEIETTQNCPIGMEILFLGTGNAFSRQYGHTNLLLKWPSSHLLIDCGSACVGSIAEYGISLAEITNIFITHLHGDHIHGLEELAIKNTYIYHQKPTLYIPKTLEKDIWDCSLRGGLECTVAGKVGLDYYFTIEPVETTFTIEGMTFEIIPTLHIPEMKSYGLYFNRIFHTSDMVFNRGLLETMLPKSDLVIHDCSFVKNPVHAYYEDLMELPKETRKEIYIVHYGDHTEKQQSSMVEAGFQCAQKHLSLKIRAKEDGRIRTKRMKL